MQPVFLDNTQTTKYLGHTDVAVIGAFRIELIRLLIPNDEAYKSSIKQNDCPSGPIEMFHSRKS